MDLLYLLSGMPRWAGNWIATANDMFCDEAIPMPFDVLLQSKANSNLDG